MLTLLCELRLELLDLTIELIVAEGRHVDRRVRPRPPGSPLSPVRTEAQNVIQGRVLIRPNPFA